MLTTMNYSGDEIDMDASSEAKLENSTHNILIKDGEFKSYTMFKISKYACPFGAFILMVSKCFPWCCLHASFSEIFDTENRVDI